MSICISTGGIAASQLQVHGSGLSLGSPHINVVFLQLLWFPPAFQNHASGWGN